MKPYFLVFLAVLTASCSLDLNREELSLELPSYFDSERPSFPYRLTGGSHLQGYIRLYRAGEEGLSASSLEGFDTLIPFPASGQGQFQFRSPLEEGAYLLQSSLAVSRGGLVSELLGSTKEAYFSVIYRPDLAPVPPEWKIVTDEKTGRLLLRLVHPLRLDEWSGNPLAFHGQVSQSEDSGAEPADPPEPDPGQVSQLWTGYREIQTFRNPGTGSVYPWIKAKAIAWRAGGSSPSAVEDLEHRFELSLSDVTIAGQAPAVQSLRKSQDMTEIKFTPRWTLYGADGSALPAAAEKEILLTVVNKSDGSASRIPLYDNSLTLIRNQVLPMSSGSEITVQVRSSDLTGVSSLGVSPNSELIFTIKDTAFGGYPIHVAD